MAVRRVSLATSVCEPCIEFHPVFVRPLEEFAMSRPLTQARLLVTLMMAFAATAFAAGAAAAPPAVGSLAPAFSLPDQDGKTHQLADYRGKWVVLYFYPKDGTPGCTTQACTFRDDIFAFRRAGAVILGVSVDDTTSHAEFAKTHRLPFTLLADRTQGTAKAYDVLRDYLVFKYASRQTFLINPQGRVAVHYPDADPDTGAKLVLADLQRLQAAVPATPAAPTPAPKS
jgi:peroxiredoxin Q/BCP